jgi:RNA polymerase sigma-70 factor (ECF subfamily)
VPVDAAPITPDAITPDTITPDLDAELEALLDEESDAEFGETEAQVASAEPRAVLKEWSAQDFANIYTRFRPHLERHARRFLRNPSQVDEVVQDAFLYLMVTLPELDSEVGVLRFLKWKTRLLCLDVIRASGRAQISNIDAHAEFESNDPEMGSNLEQAEDAAIVRLALSKLNPRHREVLLASMYEEKSTREIAAQVGLSENATLQLIFRARSAFKKALLGDNVETAGMSVSAILSVAARKAAADAKRVGAQAMVFALFLVLSIGGFVSFANNNPDATTVAEGNAPASETSEPAVTAPTDAPNAKTTTDEAPVATTEPAPVNAPVISTVVNIPSQAPAASPSPSSSPFSTNALATIYDSSKSEVFFARTSQSTEDFGVDAAQGYLVNASQGISAEFVFEADAAVPFKNVVVAYIIDGVPYFSYPTVTDVVVGVDPFGIQHVVYFGKAKYFADANRKVYTDEKLSNSTVRIELVIKKDRSGVQSTNLDLLRAE